MTNGEHDGFTIIEVTLFLAISAMLLMIAFTFTGSTLRNMRFTDATKSLQGFFQQQYTRVQTNSLALNTPSGSVPSCSPTNGVGISTNPGNSSTGASQNCILLGSALDISSDGRSITVSPVLGHVGDGTATLRASNPQIWAAAAETYQLQWQAAIRAGNEAGNGQARIASTNTESTARGGWSRLVNRLLFLKDTQSEKINFYAITQESKSITAWLTENITANTIRNIPTLICIQSDDGGSLRGAIQFIGDSQQQGIGIDAITSSVVGTAEPFFPVTGFGGLTCG